MLTGIRLHHVKPTSEIVVTWVHMTAYELWMLVQLVCRHCLMFITARLAWRGRARAIGLLTGILLICTTFTCFRMDDC